MLFPCDAIAFIICYDFRTMYIGIETSRFSLYMLTKLVICSFKIAAKTGPAEQLIEARGLTLKWLKGQ